MLALTDRCCDELLDTEYRTACRRFLARAAADVPETFHRRGRPAITAAAVCWIIAKANKRFDSDRPRNQLRVKDLVRHFGTSQGSVSQRGQSMPDAMGFYHDPYGPMELHSPNYLTSAYRAEIIALRDKYSAPAVDPAG